MADRDVFLCTNCGGELPVPEVGQDVSVRCSHCRAIVTYSPPEKIKGSPVYVSDQNLTISPTKAIRNYHLYALFQEFNSKIRQHFQPNKDCPECRQFVRALSTVNSILTNHICSYDGIPACQHEECQSCQTSIGPAHDAHRLYEYKGYRICAHCKDLWEKKGGSFIRFKQGGRQYKHKLKPGPKKKEAKPEKQKRIRKK